MSPETPRTDAATFEILSALQSGKDKVVHAHVAAQLELENADLVAALEGVMGLIESGWLVRNTSQDSMNQGWAMKQLEPTLILGRAKAALAKVKP